MSSTEFGATPRTHPAAGATTWLRRFLALDAVVTGGNGLIYLLVSGPVGDLLGIDSGLLLGLGAFLIVYGVAVGVLAGRPQPPAGAVSLVVLANLCWAVLSIVALAAWLDAGTAGTVWVPLQAVVVGGFAALQYGALRRAAG